jgi:hypothetical protein
MQVAPILIKIYMVCSQESSKYFLPQLKCFGFIFNRQANVITSKNMCPLIKFELPYLISTVRVMIFESDV